MKITTPAEQWLEDLRGLERCQWCGVDSKRRTKAGLCRSCRNIERQLATADKRLSEIPETTDSYQRFLLRHERDVIDNKKQIRLANGMEIEMILNGEEFSALDLEELFSRVSSAVCHYPKLHGGIATRLGETFTPKQRQVLGYLFWNTLRNAKVPLTVTTLGAS